METITLADGTTLRRVDEDTFILHFVEIDYTVLVRNTPPAVSHEGALFLLLRSAWESTQE